MGRAITPAPPSTNTATNQSASTLAMNRLIVAPPVRRQRTFAAGGRRPYHLHSASILLLRLQKASKITIMVRTKKTQAGAALIVRLPARWTSSAIAGPSWSFATCSAAPGTSTTSSLTRGDRDQHPFGAAARPVRPGIRQKDCRPGRSTAVHLSAHERRPPPHRAARPRRRLGSQVPARHEEGRTVQHGERLIRKADNRSWGDTLEVS